ncbi:MAG: type II toxin-antitoxin system HipA family toxin [Proteobacteria bacterium]|nr:type II toxin-antitoxin system HipA family toxin [Pseudomonadota bacterium]
MIKVGIGGHAVGTLARSRGKAFAFSYIPGTPARDAVSLTMPPRVESYASSVGHLHPIFDMNLPEGFLRQWLLKVIPDFDDLTLLNVTGASQIGRLQYDSGQPAPAGMNVQDILAYDGAEDLFQHLLDVYATASGVSGVQPKVLIRDVAGHKLSREEKISQDHRVTVTGTTHIVKTWDQKYPQLALNEHFCLRAAKHAGLAVPEWSISQNGKFLVVERFDVQHDGYLGVEDFCVLAGMTSEMKYHGSYEQMAKSLKMFVSPDTQISALRDYFKMIVLSCVVRNGDAHRKNFCLFYDSAESRLGQLAPTFDIVTTTAYIAMDSMAMLLGGSKRWPTREKLLRFAAVCGLLPEDASRCLDDVEEGVTLARKELQDATIHIPEFQEVGAAMDSSWQAGLKDLSSKTGIQETIPPK